MTLTAKNSTSTSGGTALYDLGYSYTMPPGVSYVAGSATADGQTLPDPVQSSLANNAGTLLVFSNVSDLVAGDQKSIAFRVMPSTSTLPVGTSFTGTAQVAGSGDARMVPTFDGTGKPATNTTNSAAATSNATAVSAITVSKAEASPEHERVRGVHTHPTVYTLTVQNTATAPSNTVTVTDYLPAGLEFLQCGGVDNTTTGPEYPGAPDLKAATSANATGPGQRRRRRCGDVHGRSNGRLHADRGAAGRLGSRVPDHGAGRGRRTGPDHEHRERLDPHAAVRVLRTDPPTG
ncbi:hypothetical protein GCM10009769_09820 [Curtobacterium luteum]|uniref:DUF11 domain-containing protein n=1 Tax=Curtobacterium luteum TaxID=33881 RepID=A0A8H9G6X4_9MICO|nr:hypothetical protein GCM10009769_09820 [Curtobacterium luteum]